MAAGQVEEQQAGHHGDEALAGHAGDGQHQAQRDHDQIPREAPHASLRLLALCGDDAAVWGRRAAADRRSDVSSTRMERAPAAAAVASPLLFDS
jgi:hypothetical protein